MGGAFIDSSILSHHHIFTKYMVENSILSIKEYKQCCKLFDAILNTIECIFLYCDLKQNKNRVSERNRVNEINNESYINLLKMRFDVLYENNKNNIIKIDITDLNPYHKNDFLLFYNFITCKKR